MAEATADGWKTAEERAQDIAQAKALCEPARRGGLRLEVYLPPVLAEWVLDLVERGVFTDPSEAVFVMLGEQRELAPHADLRQECLRRSIAAAIEDSRPHISQEEFKARLKKLTSEPSPPVATWEPRKPR